MNQTIQFDHNYTIFNFTQEVFHDYLYQPTREVFRDYLYQPIPVTINNIYKEFPSFDEIFLMAVIKSEAIPVFRTFFSSYAASLLANPYGGSFFTDLVKGGQSLACWAFGLKHGTKDYELHRPAADILKGLCKITLMSQGMQNVFIRDTFCEVPARAFLDAMNEMKINQLDRTDINSWYITLNDKEFWIDVVRKSVLKVLAGKLVFELGVAPTTNFIFPFATKAFDSVGLSNVLKFMLDQHALKFDETTILPLASPASVLKEAFTSSMIMPFVRTVNYAKTNEVVIVKYADKFLCKKFMDVYNSAEAYHIDINYKYDANITAYNTCKVANKKPVADEQVDLAELFSQGGSNELTIYYPEGDDVVGKVEDTLVTAYDKVGEFGGYFTHGFGKEEL